jgi:hypothetical protein
VKWLRDTHHYVLQHLKVASIRVEAHFEHLAKSKRLQEGDPVWLYCPTHTWGKSPKLQSSWEGPYSVIIRISDIVYRIQRRPRAKTIDRVTLGCTQDVQPWGGSSDAGTEHDGTILPTCMHLLYHLECSGNQLTDLKDWGCLQTF